MTQRITVGLIGYGKAGKAVARVLQEDERFDLRWIMRRSATPEDSDESVKALVHDTGTLSFDELFDRHPVNAVVDFSHHSTVHAYHAAVARMDAMLVSAISHYEEEDLAVLRRLAETQRVLSSPNITVGINFLILAARLLHTIAPFADVAVMEQHFKEKPEVSGTARKIASTLEVDQDSITSLRLGGIVGHHEVIFGFPYQTVRLIHDSIRREAFGTGAAFALMELQKQPHGFYTFEDLLMQRVRQSLLEQEISAPGLQ